MAYTLRENISYGAHAMDIYLPEHADGQNPAVLVIHGGGWVSQRRNGRREQSISIDLASAGYVAVSVDYTLVDLEHPDASKDAWPQMLYDCRNAVGFLRKHAAEYHIDPDAVGALGGSAGGHLAAMLGVVAPSGNLRSGRSVEAVVDLYGPGDLNHWIPAVDESLLAVAAARIMFGGIVEEAPEEYRRGSPVHYVSNQSSPFLLLHGENDSIISPSESEHFYRALQKASVEAELVVVPDAPHSFDLHPESQDIAGIVIGFFDKHLRKW